MAAVFALTFFVTRIVAYGLGLHDLGTTLLSALLRRSTPAAPNAAAVPTAAGVEEEGGDGLLGPYPYLIYGTRPSAMAMQGRAGQGRAGHSAQCIACAIDSMMGVIRGSVRQASDSSYTLR